MRREWMSVVRVACVFGVVAIGACSEDPKGADAVDTVDAQADALDSVEPEVDAGEDGAGDAAEVEVAEKPGLGIDYGTTAPGAMPRFDLGAEDWMSVGWPSDRYRSNGHVKLTNMPQNVEDLLVRYMEFGEQVLDGWGLNGAVYFEMDRAIDVGSLPSADATRAADAVIQLVNVTAGSAHRGERMPLVFEFHGTTPDPFYRKNTLAMRAVYGFPLVEGETYCALVTRAVKDANGNYLQQAPGFAAALRTEASLAPLVAWLADSPLAEKDLATATCFTTQRAMRELLAVSHWVDDMEPPEVESIFEPGVWGEFHGTYHAPNFQAGVKPYATEGGDIRFDEAGQPIVQEDEEIRFLLLTPTDYEMPADGWPVTIYAHGTGGDYESCRGDTRELIADGIAVLCVDQPLHGSRGPNGSLLSEAELVLYSFNFINPAAGRSAFREAAIDTLILSRMIEAGSFSLTAGGTKAGTRLALDADKIYFFGHSHGGLSGTLALAVDPRIKAGIISGMAGVIIETILRRKDPADLSALASTLLGVEQQDLDTFHPALNLMQMLVDATDPITYTRYWISPPPGVSPKHVFVTEGTMDAASPSVGTDAATAAGDVPQLLPIAKRSEGHELRGLAPVSLPVKDNVEVAPGQYRTLAIRQWQGGSHFVAFNAADARALWRNFLKTEAYGDGATLTTEPYVLTRQTPVSASDTCEGARDIPTASGFPIEVRGNTQAAAAELTTRDCGGDASEVGAVGRDVFYRFTAPTEGTYRFRIALQPARDKDHPRFGPNVVALLDACAGTCKARKVDGAIDLAMADGESVVVAIDGAGPANVGAFSLVVEQRCEVKACGARTCGAWGCGSCGSCDGQTTCSADGQCVARLAGDTCATAIEVSALPFSWSGDTRDYENDAFYTPTQCPGFPFQLGQGSDDVVFRFVPPTSAVYVATLDGDYDTNLWVSRQCENAGAGCLGAQRTGYRDARVLIDGEAGVPVFVFVDGASNTGNSAGHGTLQIAACVPDCEGRACGDDGCGGSCGACEGGASCVVVPGKCTIPYDCAPTTECKSIPGDICESAIAVGNLPFSDAKDTASGFYDDYGFRGSWCAAQADGSGTKDTWGYGAADVAYRFTAPKDGLYRFGLDTGYPTIFDASLYVVGDCNDIEASCVGGDERDRNERVWARLTKDQTVFAIVDGWVNFGPQTGKYTLDVRECVATCQNKECGSDGCVGSCGGCGAGLTCQGFRCLKPPGEICANPRGVGQLPWKESGSTAGYGADRASACEGAEASAKSPEVTYRFEAPKDGTFRFVVAAEFGAQVYVDGACDSGLCLAGGIVDGPAGAQRYQVDRTMVKGEAVLVTIDGVDRDDAGVSGAYTFSVAEACDPKCEGKECGADGCGGVCGVCSYPSDICTAEAKCVAPAGIVGNTCESAREVGALPFIGESDTSKGASDDYLLDEAQCAGFVAKGMGSADEVWRFTATTAGSYEVLVEPDGWDAIVYVVGDCGDAVGTCRGASDAQIDERLGLTLSAGESVFIVVDGEDNVQNDVGAYRIRVEAR